MFFVPYCLIIFLNARGIDPGIILAMGEAMRVAIYARVSTTGQTTDNQLTELQRVAQRHGWDIVAVYTDNGTSGAKGRDQRPEFDAMLRAATAREFDMIAAWSLDRLGRSLQHLVAFLGDIHAQGIEIYLHQQRIDTSTPSGKAMFGMMGVFAEFEREMIRERINAGIARAREHGTKSGRPHGRPGIINNTLVRQVRDLRTEGTGIKTVAKRLGVGVGTVQKIVREFA